MFKAIGNFFRDVFSTPSKPVLETVPDKIEPPIVKLGPEKVEPQVEVVTPVVQNVVTQTEQVTITVHEEKVKKPRAKKAAVSGEGAPIKKAKAPKEPKEKKTKPKKAQ